MPEANGKTRKWRSKFAATKRVIAADAPPSSDAKKALLYAAIGAALTIAGLVVGLLTDKGWIVIAVWPVGLPLAIFGGLRGKFEGDVIKAGRSPVRGKTMAMTGVALGVCTVALAVVYLIVTIFTQTVIPNTLPGKYGDPVMTYKEYVRSLHEDDFDAFVACFSLDIRFDLDRDDDGVRDAMSEKQRKLFENRFEKAKRGRVKNDLSLPSKPEYSAGGDTALDAGRARLQILCQNKRIDQVTDARMKFKREEDGWKITETDL